MWAQKQKGFTIVELLIVIVVIAILAAITIVAFNGVQQRAQASTIQNDLRNIATKLKLFQADNGRYPSNVTELAAMEFKASKNAYATSSTVAVNLGFCTKGDYSGFAVFAMTKSGDRYYVTDSSSPTVDTTGTTWTAGTGTLSNQCAAVGNPTNFSHGYVASDATTGPWRAWAGGN